MAQSRKKIKTIITVAVLCVFTALVGSLIGCGKKESDETNIERYVRFTDNATGEIYDVKAFGIEFRIPYDGLEHTFSYEVLNANDNTPLGEKGDFYKDESGKVVKEPGLYTFRVLSKYNRYERELSMDLTVDELVKLQPEMEFNHDGVLEGYVYGEYGEQIFTYTPDISGQYTFSVPDGKVAVSDELITDWEYEDSKTVDLEKGETVYIAVKGVKPGKYKLIEFIPPEFPTSANALTLQGGEIRYYSFKADKFQAYNFTLSDSANIRASVWKGDYPLTGFDENCVRGAMFENIAWIKIENLSSAENTFTLKVELPKEIAVGEKYNNRKFGSEIFKLVPAWSGRYSAEIKASFADVRLYNEAFAENVHFDTQFPISFDLVCDKTYYIKIDSVNPVTANSSAVNIEVAIKPNPGRLPLGKYTIVQNSPKQIFAVTP